MVRGLNEQALPNLCPHARNINCSRDISSCTQYVLCIAMFSHQWEYFLVLGRIWWLDLFFLHQVVSVLSSQQSTTFCRVLQFNSMIHLNMTKKITKNLCDKYLESSSDLNNHMKSKKQCFPRHEISDQFSQMYKKQLSC